MENKTLFSLILGVFFLSIYSCDINVQERTETVVDKYLDTTLNDPSSYQSISFSPIKKDKYGFFEIQHTYRAKNGFGALIKTTQWFQVDTSFKYCDVDNYHMDVSTEVDAAKLVDSTRKADSIAMK